MILVTEREIDFLNLGLTEKQSEIAAHVTYGESNQEIANKLKLAEQTVKFHLTNIYKKLGIKNRAELVQVFMKMKGWTNER